MIHSLFMAFGLTEFAPWADLIYMLIALSVTAFLFVYQLKMINRGLVIDRLRGDEAVNPFKEHPLAYRVVLLVICTLVGWFWPLYGAIKLAQFVNRNFLTKTS